MLLACLQEQECSGRLWQHIEPLQMLSYYAKWNSIVFAEHMWVLIAAATAATDCAHDAYSATTVKLAC